MNIVVYLVVWAVIGLLIGFLANWITKSCVWPWFWIDLLVGMLGAIITAYFIGGSILGIIAILTPISLLFAVIGAVNFLLIAWLIKKAFC